MPVPFLSPRCPYPNPANNPSNPANNTSTNCPNDAQSPGGGADFKASQKWDAKLRKEYWEAYEALQWGCNDPGCWDDGYPAGKTVTLPNGDSFTLDKKKEWDGSWVVLDGRPIVMHTDPTKGTSGYQVHHIFEQKYGYDNSWRNLVPLATTVRGTENRHSPLTTWWQGTTALLRTYQFFAAGPNSENNPNRPHFVPPPHAEDPPFPPPTPPTPST